MVYGKELKIVFTIPSFQAFMVLELEITKNKRDISVENINSVWEKPKQ